MGHPQCRNVKKWATRRDPDGYLIEVGQYTQVALDWFNNHT
jgi:hypothetical protein